MSQPDIVKQILSSEGYWRVNIRPLDYKEDAITDLSTCWEILEKRGVYLRGWKYPHVDSNSDNRSNHMNYVESQTSWEGRSEWMRLYKSGQFLHYITLREDKVRETKTILEKLDYSNIKGIEFVNAIWCITEFYEFASRLVSEGIMSSGVEIDISLNGAKDRSLFFWKFDRELFQEYKCKTPKIELKTKEKADVFLGKSREIAVEKCIQFFEIFGANIDRSIIESDQDRLYSRRF